MVASAVNAAVAASVRSQALPALAGNDSDLEDDELEVEDGSGGEPLGVWTFKEEDPLRPVQCVRMCRYACARARRRNYVPG